MPVFFSLNDNEKAGQNLKPIANCRRTGAFVALIAAMALLAGAAAAKKESVKVKGFAGSYSATETPSEDWGSESEEKWIVAFSGQIETEKTLAYRSDVLPPGKYDMWAEKGKNNWCYFFIGKKSEEESPRLRAMFKLYEQEEGVEKLRFDLKLTRRATKLKLSISAGRSEGHGNLRIIEKK